MNHKIFIDSSFLITLINTSDINHLRAQNIYKTIIDRKCKILTIDTILIELGDFFSRPGWRSIGSSWIRYILHEKDIYDVIPITEYLFMDALNFFEIYRDKEWGFTECISFVTMKKHKISEVLTFDHHFEQAGFTDLIKNL